MGYLPGTQIQELKAVKNQIHFLGTQNQLEEIRKFSPYSAQITSFIRQYEELRLYCDLQLQESEITRPCILREIDFDLWITSEGCINRELMQKGNAPYLFDAPNGKMELHHIGQDYSAPFAELTIDEHSENSQLLHVSREESWRNDKKLEKAFIKERSAYWKKRVKLDYVIAEHGFEALPASHYQKQQEYLAELRNICEAVYMQCEAEDLDYLSDLARSYAMMQRVGATTMGEFLQVVRQEKQEEIHCTVCGFTDYVFHGTYQTRSEKIQRYKCRKCGKIFSSFHKCLVSGSSFSFREWIKFIDCLYNGYTIKQIADACNISERTAHENRTKLFYALKLLNDKVQLKGNVVLDETYLPVSYKGNHSKQEDFVMPREANYRGGENHKSGLSDNLVCVICAVDDSGNSVAKVAGVGASTAGKLKYVLQEHFSNNIFCLYSDKSPVLKSLAESCSIEIKQQKLLRKGTKRAEGVPLTKDTFIINRYLQIINSYHSRLKKFLNRFSGISTKYLSGYLYLFAWKERSKDQEPEEAYRELLRIMTEPNHYLSVEDIVKDGHIPEANHIEKQYRKGWCKNPERDEEIYRRYANGETMTSIAADLGVSKQNVSQTIKKLRKQGKAYRTEWDIQRETPKEKPKKPPICERSQGFLERDYQIYYERQKWDGSSDEFVKAASTKYGLSIQSVRNTISRMKRIIRLKEEVFIYENVSYQSMGEVYQSVYSDYMGMKSGTGYIPYEERIQKLGEKYGFTPQNIIRIVQIMATNTDANCFSGKHRLTKTETYNRDKAIFIDFLRWPGKRTDFYDHAAEKYGLAPYYVYIILKYCLFADPERYESI